MSKIKAIVFDWGGVMVKNVMPEILQYSADKLGVTKEELVPVYEKYQHGLMINTITEKEFWSRISRDLKVNEPDSPSLFGEAFSKFFESNDEMTNFVKELKDKNILTGLLSDAEKAAVRQYFKDSQPLFDAMVFSSVVGVEKPDAGIYEIILKELDVKAEEAIFFDDRIENIEGAKKVGIHAFLFESIEQVKNILKDYGIKV